MTPPALQTSDLISDISAVIATGTFLHLATSSASAGYFCGEVARTWQEQQQHKPMPLGLVYIQIITEPRGCTRSTVLLLLSVCSHRGFTSHTDSPCCSSPGLQRAASVKALWHRPSRLTVAYPLQQICFVTVMCAYNTWIHFFSNLFQKKCRNFKI